MLRSVLDYLGLGRESEERWVTYYLLLGWSAELGNGVIQTITGPMQPYLAFNLETDTSTINLVWTLGFMGFLVGSLLTSHIFTKYLKTARLKLLTLFFVLFLTGLSTAALPFSNNLPLLLLSRFIQFLCYGIFLTGDSVLLVYTLGPEKSRPFINTLHFFISIGFLLGTFLVQPFLPETREKVCRSKELESQLISGNASLADIHGNSSVVLNELFEGNKSAELVAGNNSLAVNTEVIENMLGIQSIAWPFIISAGWCMLVSAGFLMLATSSLEMPQFYDENTNTRHKDVGLRKLTRGRKHTFLVFIILFFALSGAIVRVFQSMSMTFALCGPLALASHRAALTDSFYSSGMCLGRLVSILLATRFLPSTLLCGSTVCCLAASLLLVVLAPHYAISLYCGVAIMGFFVSWQFGTGFSWTSQHMNITGRLSSIFFIGLGLGSLSSPPLAGLLFSMEPMSVLYLVALMVAIQASTVAALACISGSGMCTSGYILCSPAIRRGSRASETASY